MYILNKDFDRVKRFFPKGHSNGYLWCSNEWATPKTEPLLSSHDLLHFREFRFFFFSLSQYRFSFKWSASPYQSLGCLWISIQKWLSLHKVHPALGWNEEMIIQQTAVSLLNGSGKAKKSNRSTSWKGQFKTKLIKCKATTFSQKMPWDL